MTGGQDHTPADETPPPDPNATEYLRDHNAWEGRQ